MASEIRVNTFKNRSGLGTITVSDSGASFSGVVTATNGFSGDLTGNATGLSGSPTLSGITSVSTTNLTVNGNSYPSAGPLSNRNLIINGSMVVNQRGWTGAAGTTTDQAYTTDRFIIGYSHDGAVSAGQTSMNSTVGGAAYADGFQNALFFKVTTADATLGADQFQYIAQQRIEGYNVQGIKKGTANAQPVTLSFWCRSTTTGTYIAELFDNDNTRQCSQAYTINAANTWEKKTLTYPADTTGVFDNDNALSLYVLFWAAAGSTYSSGTLQTSWATSTAENRAAGQTNLLATAGNDFFLTGVQLEVGSVATPFEHRSYGDELARCQRYYQTTGASGAPTNAFGGYVGATYPNNASSYGTARFHVPMRATPAVVLYDGAGTSGTATQNGTANGISASAAHITIYGFTIVQKTTGVWTDDARYTIYAGYTASAEL